MKQLQLSIILLALGLFVQTHGQENSTDEIVWFGLDYSHVKFIGQRSDFNDIPKIQNHYFASWNDLVLDESNKYDVKGAFGARTVTYDIERAVSRSADRSMQGIVQSGSYELSKVELADALKAYIIPSVNKTGVLFIMETLNKPGQTSTMWVVVFNIATSEIHHLKRYSGIPGGFGFRNYWARPYYNVLASLKKNPRKPY
jgi:hypothetical protein